MGSMWMDGLRSLSHSNQVKDSPWLLPKDKFGKELDTYSKTEVEIDPFALSNDSMLGGDAIKSLRVFHSPECFEKNNLVPPLTKWQNIELRLEKLYSKDKSITGLDDDNIAVEHNIRMSAHSLDTSFQCKRRHWLEQVKGWSPEPIYLIKSDSNLVEQESVFVSPTLFGTIVHRLLEIGLKNPSKVNGPPVMTLPSSWQNENDNLLKDEKLVKEVLLEEGITQKSTGIEKKRALAMEERISQISKLVDNGLIGRYAEGEVHHGRIPEGLRTELPFFYQHSIEMKDVYRLGFSIEGLRRLSKVENTNFTFDGRADLVLAFRDKDETGYLQVIDLKTTGCRNDFNSEDSNLGSPLQVVEGDLLNRFPQTDAERQILHEHRLQLALYSMALEAIELDKPKELRRIILPPAILVGASGRSIELTLDEYKQAKTDLKNHLLWMAELSAEPTSLQEPGRIEGLDNAICKKCPFYRGDIKLCGPKHLSIPSIKISSDQQ
jgi:hypothetical protein